MAAYGSKRRGARLDRSHDLSRGLAGLWLLDEGCGRLARDAAAARHALVGTGAAWQAGPWGPQIRQGATSGVRLNIADEAGSGLAAGAELTVEILARHDDAAPASTDYLLAKAATTSTQQWLLLLNTSNQLFFRVHSDGGSTIFSRLISNAAFTDCDLWHHYAATFNRGQIRLYRDGLELPGTFTTGGGGVNLIGHQATDLAIGAANNGSLSWPGAIAKVAVYRRALGAAEIRRLAADPFIITRRSRAILALGAAACFADGAAAALDPQAAFTDRDQHDGLGHRVALSPGCRPAIEMIERQITGPRFAARLMMRVQQVSGGQITFMQGAAADDQQVFTGSYSAADSSIRIDLPAGPPLAAFIPPAIEWHCIELRVRAESDGEASLWINGVLSDAAAGDFSGRLATRLQFGCIAKDYATTGHLDLDEIALASADIGPVKVEPVSLHADDPRRWAVIYRRDLAASAQWAAAYRLSRNLPHANLIGLDLPADEVISLSDFESLRDAVIGYLQNNGLDGSIMGLLCGPGVPGLYVDEDDELRSVAGSLRRLQSSTLEAANPHVGSMQSAPDVRLAAGQMQNILLTARIDGPDPEASLAMMQRAAALEALSVLSADTARLWLDPHGPATEFHQSRGAQMLDWADSAQRGQLRLHLHIPPEEAAPGESEPGFPMIENDGFYWGWNETWPAEDFFGASGARIFFTSISVDAPTAGLMRTAPDDWAGEAIAAGYAAAAGACRAVGGSALPLVGAFFDALRRGWTLAEAWLACLPVLHAGQMLMGDPLLRLRLPRAGWNLYRCSDWSQVDFDQPAAALRLDELELPAALADLPEDSPALCILRRVDDAGREEAGLLHLRGVRRGASLARIPDAPLWPSVGRWLPRRIGGAIEAAIRWAGSCRDAGASSVRLIEQIQGAEPAMVLAADVDPDSCGIDMRHTSAAAPGSLVRYQLQILSVEDVAIATDWGEWITTPASPEIRPLLVLD